MNSTRKILIRITSIFSAIIITAMLLPACGLDPLTGEDSPDNNKIALAYTYRFGNSNTYVSIDYKDTRRSFKIMKLHGIVPVSFTWKSDKELIVHLPSKSLIEKTYRESLGDLTIQIQEGAGGHL